MRSRQRDTDESESNESTDESEDPSGTLSGENEDGSVTFQTIIQKLNDYFTRLRILIKGRNYLREETIRIFLQI